MSLDVFLSKFEIFVPSGYFLAMELRSSALCWKMTFLGLNCVFGAQDDLGWVCGLLEMCSERSDLQNNLLWAGFRGYLRLKRGCTVAVQIFLA